MTRQCGLSFIEMLIFIVVVSIAMVSILSIFNVTVKGSVDPMINKQATAVAEAMLEEILNKDFFEGVCPTADVVEKDRGAFDDVCDYHGFNQTEITTINNKSILALASYTLSVDVAAASLGSSDVAVLMADAKLVTVAVIGNRNSITLSGYRANYE